MSNNYLRQRFQPPQGPQQASSSTQNQSRGAAQQTSSRQQAQTSQQTHQPLQTQQAVLDDQFRQAEAAYLASYYPERPFYSERNASTSAYHTIDPASTRLNQDASPYELYRPAPQPEGVQPQQTSTSQQSEHRDMQLLMEAAQSPAPAQQTASQTTANTRRSRVRRQQPASAQSEGSPNEETGDITMHEAEEPADSEDEDADADDDDPNKPRARLAQAIIPLHYPTVRPTLLLGPYDTKEEVVNACIEYAVAQGYMLVQSSSVRSRTGPTEPNGDPRLLRIDLMCDRGGSCKNSGTGRRKRLTQRIGCPTRFKLVCRQRDGMKWVIEPRSELHNHDLNLGNMDSLASYRRWRRMQAGGPRAEPRKERSARTRTGTRPTLPAPVPPPTFHTPGPLPPAEPTGPVHMAALKGQVRILDILLQKGADIDAHDTTGRTALHCAIEGSRMDAVQLLVDKGANVSRMDSKGLSPLRMAVEKGLEDAVVLLIEKGADPNK
ncbi:hypothetical protein N0V88_002677 [Collariella sp. IMI 366227]|nr:hypothetical protein N0V88_002677 [Collariella sp. IMI 366227]